MSFDTKCFELAEHFCPDDADLHRKNVLAQHIQDAVEDFLYAEEEPEPAGSSDRDEWRHEAVEQQRLK